MILTRQHIRLSPKKKLLLGGSLALIVIIVALAVYLMLYAKQNRSELSSVKEAVSKHYLLPTDEEPALLTVVDKEKLSSAFLKNKAENGDKVLVYQTNQRVIIYRPSLDRVIDVGPVVIDNPSH